MMQKSIVDFVQLRLNECLNHADFLSPDLAAKSAYGSWRLSDSPELYYALPDVYFKHLGLPVRGK